MKAIMPVKNNNGLDAELNPRFGRTPFFAVVDIDSEEVEFVNNSAQNAASGAGVEAAQIVADQKADLMFTPRIGPRAFTGLNKLKMKVYLAEGSIKDAIDAYKNDELEEVDKPTNAAQHDH
ncbi:MAG: NifB/NifX family molybdenum-iron cluster-binding protein [Halanaerobiales bacterium]